MTRLIAANRRKSSSEMAKLRPTRWPSRPSRQYRRTRPADNPSRRAACSVVSNFMLPIPRLAFACFDFPNAFFQGVDFSLELLGGASRSEGDSKVLKCYSSQVQQIGHFLGYATHDKLLVQRVKMFNCLYCTGIGTISKPTSAKIPKFFAGSQVGLHGATDQEIKQA